MRKVVLYTLMSLDGVAEEPGDWMFDVDPPVFENLARIIGTQDDVLLGRGTYDYWVEYWPKSDVEPFAGFINSATKHVVTSTPLGADWANTTIVDAPVVDHVAAMKRGAGRDIGVHGSISLAQSLLSADLLDEVHLVIAPTLSRGGRRLFEDQRDVRRLTLTSTHSSPAGNLFVSYRVDAAPARPEGTS